MGEPSIVFVSREVYPFDSAGLGNYVTFTAEALASVARVSDHDDHAIRDGENGLTFRCGDPDDLARALRLAIADPVLRARLARSAQTESMAYSWDRAAALHAAAFIEVAGRHGAEAIRSPSQARG